MFGLGWTVRKCHFNSEPLLVALLVTSCHIDFGFLSRKHYLSGPVHSRCSKASIGRTELQLLSALPQWLMLRLLHVSNFLVFLIFLGCVCLMPVIHCWTHSQHFPNDSGKGLQVELEVTIDGRYCCGMYKLVDGIGWLLYDHLKSVHDAFPVPNPISVLTSF